MKTLYHFNYQTHCFQFENEMGEEWVYPPLPSGTQMLLFGELVKRCREKGINENAIEVRVGKLWVDIAIYYRGYKIAVEVHGPEKKICPKRTKYLNYQGWRVINVPARAVDKSVTRTAELILDQVEKVVEKESI